MREAAKDRRALPVVGSGAIRVLAIPPPYRAWLTISNDPDNTTIENWRELHSYIWEELGLPFSDSLFVRSRNQNLPGQVNLYDHPEIAHSHYFDSLHTWGDYSHARKRGFDREDAVEAIALLREHNLNPKIWVDHSGQDQNMLHRSSKGSTPYRVDGAGHKYRNYSYTLDLVHQIGIRYIWDGKLASVLGQDVEPAFRLEMSLRKMLNALSWHFLPAAIRNLLVYKPPERRQYFPFRFDDQQTFYCFQRYGLWSEADIDGLAKVISEQIVDELINREGTCIVYTHLGKRKAWRSSDAVHIPADTRAALRHLKKRYDEQALMLSPVSTMLDYLVLRDNIVVSAERNSIDFRPDGLRFESLQLSDLRGFSFGLRIDNENLGRQITVTIDGNAAEDTSVELMRGKEYLIKFRGSSESRLEQRRMRQVESGAVGYD